nr:hypothetical protein Q903MT_gene2309 [Picea sitchensis]
MVAEQVPGLLSCKCPGLKFEASRNDSLTSGLTHLIVPTHIVNLNCKAPPPLANITSVLG